MEVKSTPAQIDESNVQLTFITDFSSKQYELFEIDEKLLDGLISGKEKL